MACADQFESPPPERAAEAEPDRILDELKLIDWAWKLRNHAGCTFDADTGHLLCPQGRSLLLVAIPTINNDSGPGKLRFSRPRRGCEDCPSLCGSPAGGKSGWAKVMTVNVTADVATRLREERKLWSVVRQRRMPQPRINRPLTPPKRRPPAAYIASLSIVPINHSSPPLAILPSLFLPSLARHLARSATSELTTSITLTEPPPTPKPHPLLATSIPHKQHRRKTWQAHTAHFALDHLASVHIVLAGGEALWTLLSSPAKGLETQQQSRLQGQT